MNTRLRLGFALLLVSLLAVAGWFMLHAPEPAYQGKSLTAWLRALEAAPDIKSPAWRDAVTAIRAIGTNGLPTLLTMLGGDDSRWESVPVSARRRLPLSCVLAGRLRLV